MFPVSIPGAESCAMSIVTGTVDRPAPYGTRWHTSGEQWGGDKATGESIIKYLAESRDNVVDNNRTGRRNNEGRNNVVKRGS